jgi:hypothetical protein
MAAATNTPKTRLAVWTASLIALAAFIDAANSVLTGARSTTCNLSISFPWCTNTGARTMADFTGTWVNMNSTTGGVPRLTVEQKLDKAIVHGWGACLPKECDWGTAETAASEASSGRLQVEWNPGFSTKQATLTIGQGDRLEFKMKTHFKDNSGRPDYELIEYFKRQ